MKNWVKVLLIVGIFLVLLGAATAAVGYFVFKAEPRTGYTVSQPDNTASDIIHAIQQETPGDGASYAVGTKGIREIEVNWASGTVTIRPTEEDNILFEESAAGVSTPLYFYTQGDELHIDFAKDLKSLIQTCEKDLVLSIPASWTPEEVSVDVASAKVTVEDGIKVRSFSMNSASGNLVVNGLTATEEFSFGSASGSVSGSGSFEEVSTETSSGGVKLTLANMPREMDFETASGQVELTLPENGGYILEFSAASGAFRSDDDYVMTRDGDIKFGNGSCKIEMRSASADLIIQHG